MNILKTAIIASTLVLSTGVNAALIDDVGSFTDDITGLVWGDMYRTDGLSYNQVLASMQTGGANEGYRVATASEVLELYNAYIPTELSTSSIGVNVGPETGVAAIFFDFFGPTHVGYEGLSDERYILGHTSDFRSENMNYHLTIQLFEDAFGGDIFFSYNTSSILENVSHENFGTYIVSAVPVPAAAWLFGSGLIGLVGFARRKK